MTRKTTDLHRRQHRVVHHPVAVAVAVVQSQIHNSINPDRLVATATAAIRNRNHLAMVEVVVDVQIPERETVDRIIRPVERDLDLGAGHRSEVVEVLMDVVVRISFINSFHVNIFAVHSEWDEHSFHSNFVIQLPER